MEEIDKLSELGVKAILCLQTRYDMRHRLINWDEMKKYYESKQILAVNFEIIDMSKEDMEIKAFHAASLLKQLIQNHNVNAIIYSRIQCI